MSACFSCGPKDPLAQLAYGGKALLCFGAESWRLKQHLLSLLCTGHGAIQSSLGTRDELLSWIQSLASRLLWLSIALGTKAKLLTCLPERVAPTLFITSPVLSASLTKLQPHWPFYSSDLPRRLPSQVFSHRLFCSECTSCPSPSACPPDLTLNLTSQRGCLITRTLVCFLIALTTGGVIFLVLLVLETTLRENKDHSCLARCLYLSFVPRSA